MAFNTTKLVRFSHCDPAGIVFYPMYFQLFNEVIEDWYAQGVGVDFRELHLARRLGMPVKKVACEYFAPSMLGDVLDCALTVNRLGGSSLDATLRVSCAGQLRAEVNYVFVMTSLETHRASPFPDDIRARIKDFVAAPPA